MVRNSLFEGNVNNSTTNEPLINKSFIDMNELNVHSNPGGAVSVYSNTTLHLVVENCTFSDNKSSDKAIDDRRPPLLQLDDGHGGAEIDVEQNAQVLFQENAAIFGGGIQMEERCRVSLYCI